MSTPEIERLETAVRNLRTALHDVETELREAREALLTFKVGDVVEARKQWGQNTAWRRAKVTRVNAAWEWERYTVVFTKKDGSWGIQPVRCSEDNVRKLAYEPMH